jgi:hypothetical protein
MSVLDIGAAVSSLSPVAVDVYGLLTGSPAVASGRVWDAVPEQPAYPFVLVEVFEQPLDTHGSSAGVFLAELVIHVYSLARGMAEAQGLMATVISRLRGSGRYWHDETIASSEELVRGDVARELIGRFRAFAGVSA